MLWSVEPLGMFYDCNDSSVIYYDLASGNTHLIEAFVAHLLQVLAKKPMDTKQLAFMVETSDEAENRTTDLESQIGNILTELAALDIVSRV